MNYDLSLWHQGCGAKQLGFSEGGAVIYCPKCQVLANVEAVACKISAVDACKTGEVDRIAVGKQTYGINKGGLS